LNKAVHRSGTPIVVVSGATNEFVAASTICDADNEGNLRWNTSGSTTQLEICRDNVWIGGGSISTDLTVVGSDIVYSDGSPGVTRTYTEAFSAKNNSTETLTVSSIASSDPESKFTLSGDNCTGETLAPGADTGRYFEQESYLTPTPSLALRVFISISPRAGKNALYQHRGKVRFGHVNGAVVP
jgi:hypothetical protein